MQLTHRFTVPVPTDVAWAALNDLERVAGCFPGAMLSSYDGDTFEGACKVKLGPISMRYEGAGRFVERDEGAGRAVLEASGKEGRGNGRASALVTTQLTSVAADVTEVKVLTDLNITGRAAQFGRGALQDVSDRLLAQFATQLEANLTLRDQEAADSTPATADQDATARPPAAVSDDLDVGAALLPVLLRRYAWQAVVATVVLAALWKRLPRR